MILGGALLLTSTVPLSALIARIALAPFICAMEIHSRRQSLRHRPLNADTILQPAGPSKR
jgi:hypothetical protein